MGFETFQTCWKPSQQDAGAIDDYLRSLPEITIDDDALRVGEARYYLWNDGDHVVEIELNDSPASLSARFVLCNPETMATVFGELLLRMQARFGGRLEIRDSVPANRPCAFGPGDEGEFGEVLRESIAVRRAEWIAMFGPRVLAANSRDVFREIILPTCVPVTETTTTPH